MFWNEAPVTWLLCNLERTKWQHRYIIFIITLVCDVVRSGNISAVYKKGGKLEAGNYRPISLTCICCKLLESIIRDHIVQFFFSNNLFSNRHNGFIKGRSTVQQLLKVLDDWTEKLDNGGRIDVLYTDLEKAFDRVPHRRLLRKLKRYNLHPDLIDWIKASLVTENNVSI